MVAPPQLMVPEPFSVAAVTRETSDVFTLRLTPRAPRQSFPFAPGQFNMLYAFGVGEAAISISGDPAQPERLIHTIRALGSVTRALTRLARGAELGVRGPFGVGWPLDAARGQDVLVVAGGLGLAPLRPAILHLLDHRADYGRLTILYGARSPEEILFRRELERWRGRLDVELAVTVDRAAGDWRGHVSVVTALIPGAAITPARTIALVCGPEVMMRYTVRDLEQLGLAQTQIYVSLERNMRCGVGLCGHCQILPLFVCKDGPVMRYDGVAALITKREI